MAGSTFHLEPEVAFTFGRDPTICTVCLGADPIDQGISRLAGSITCDNGVWWIVNRSSSRSLHVVDGETGIGVPLPVARDNWPSPRHAVDRPRLTILVPGEVLTHALSVRVAGDGLPPAETVPAPGDVVRTRNLLPHLTDKQRQALVAMVEGYLLRFPRYQPEPRTYEEAAARIGLPSSTVRKRIENVRRLLVEGGVPGLEGGDARRNLAEWLLSHRLITEQDVVRLDRGPAPGAGD